jgi:uncharacterized protein YhjY with autotransporter beta-barrel domain
MTPCVLSSLNWQTLRWLVLTLGIGCVASASPVWAQGNPFDPKGTNPTQSSLAGALGLACPDTSPALTGGLQERCNAIANDTGTPGSDSRRLNAMQTVSPEQVGAAGAEASRISGGHVSQINATLGGRMASILSGSVAAFQTQFNDEWADLDLHRSGAAGSDDATAESRLSAFLSLSYRFGDLDSTFKAIGFDYDIGGATVGIDYRVSDTVVLGAAFSYMYSKADFDGSAGDGETNSYTGSLFGLFNPTPELYITAIATVGGLDYDLTRDIKYAVTGDVVNASTGSDTDGVQFSFAGELGYDYSFEGLTAEPYFGIEARRLDIDSYRESGGGGWATAYDDQDITSLTSHIGARLSYAISTGIGVFLPQIRGEWVHEYADDDRDIGAFMVNDPSRFGFDVQTENPDRNYATLGADMSMTFAGGFAVFTGYEALVGYDRVTSHEFTLGGRIEF